MNFAEALSHLKMGNKVQRIGWNGKGMWVQVVKNWEWSLSINVNTQNLSLAPFIMMKTADNNLVPWLVSQTDLLAEDWQLVY